MTRELFPDWEISTAKIDLSRFFPNARARAQTNGRSLADSRSNPGFLARYQKPKTNNQKPVRRVHAPFIRVGL